MKVEVPVYVPIDPRLTTVAPEPKDPPLNCKDRAGRKTVCGKDFADNFDGWRAYARVLGAQITEIKNLQPPAKP